MPVRTITKVRYMTREEVSTTKKKTREINMLLKIMQWVKQDSWAIRKKLENN